MRKNGPNIIDSDKMDWITSDWGIYVLKNFSSFSTVLGVKCLIILTLIKRVWVIMYLICVIGYYIQQR